MDKKDLYIKEKLQEDKEISEKCNEVFKSFKGGEYMIDKEKKVIKISLKSFVAIAASVAIVGTLGVNLYAKHLGKPNLITSIEALVKKEEDNTDEIAKGLFISGAKEIIHLSAGVTGEYEDMGETLEHNGNYYDKTNRKYSEIEEKYGKIFTGEALENVLKMRFLNVDGTLYVNECGSSGWDITDVEVEKVNEKNEEITYKAKYKDLDINGSLDEEGTCEFKIKKVNGEYRISQTNYLEIDKVKEFNKNDRNEEESKVENEKEAIYLYSSGDNNAAKGNPELLYVYSMNEKEISFKYHAVWNEADIIGIAKSTNGNKYTYKEGNRIIELELNSVGENSIKVSEYENNNIVSWINLWTANITNEKENKVDNNKIVKGEARLLVGDADCDGLVNNDDVSAIEIHIEKWGSLTEQGKINADVNGDEIVNEGDMNILKKYLSGEYTKLPYRTSGIELITKAVPGMNIKYPKGWNVTELERNTWGNQTGKATCIFEGYINNVKVKITTYDPLFEVGGLDNLLKNECSKYGISYSQGIGSTGYNIGSTDNNYLEWREVGISTNLYCIYHMVDNDIALKLEIETDASAEENILPLGLLLDDIICGITVASY